MDFYEIALAKFAQSFPELSNYIVSFKDLTGDLSDPEESEISIGCFIIRAGQAFYYIPIIAKGENIYPIDSAFDVEKEKFLPLTSKTVVTLINANSFNIGNSSKIPGTIPQNPSVYDLVNPPRTGKFVYASSSRLTEFLSIIPNDIKEYVKSRVLDNKKLYQGLNSLFGIKEVLEPLYKPTVKPVPAIQTDSAPHKPSIITEGSGLSAEEIKQVLSVGYVIRGANTTNRIAVTAENYNRTGKFSQAGLLEPGKEYSIVHTDGSIRDGVVFKQRQMGKSFSGRPQQFVLFDDGNYAIGDNFVVQADARDADEVLPALFHNRPPVMFKHLEGSETFAIISPERELIGVYSSYSPPMRTNEGVVIKNARDLGSPTCGGSSGIFAYHNVREPIYDDGALFVPYNYMVVLLSNNITYDLEINVNAAHKKRSLAELVALGSSMDLGYDGVEFSINGNPIGEEAKVAEILVAKEGIDPKVAGSFIKQAKECKKVKIYLSKQADFEPGEIPQFGEQIPDHNKDQLAQGGAPNSFEPNTQETLGLEDPQTTEATILSELLQAPDMYEYIEEYMPDIEEALDKLGRILFLLRINLDTLGQGNNPTDIFSFISQLRNVYRMLGDNFIKLQNIVAQNNVSTETQ